MGKSPAATVGTGGSTRAGDVDCGVLLAPDMDAHLTSDTVIAHMGTFTLMGLIRQIKMMSVANASILNFIESGDMLADMIRTEKYRLKAIAEIKLTEIEEEAKKEVTSLQERLAEKEKQANEALRSLGEKNQEATNLSNDLTAARERATKAEEDLSSKTAQVADLQSQLMVVTAEKDKYISTVQKAALGTWENALE